MYTKALPYSIAQKSENLYWLWKFYFWALILGFGMPRYGNGLAEKTDIKSPPEEIALRGKYSTVFSYSMEFFCFIMSLPVNTATERGRMMNSCSIRTSCPSG